MLPAVAALGGCSDDNAPEIPSDKGRPTMGITLSLGTGSRAGENMREDYELGFDLENYIDVADGCKFYFFTDEAEPKFLYEFKPYARPSKSELDVENNVLYRYYSQFIGEVPLDLPLKFRLVTIANWPNYPEVVEDPKNDTAKGDFKLVHGETTLGDLCSHASSQFNHLTARDGVWLDQSHLIPFYGVRAYDLNDYASDHIVNGKIRGDVFVDISKAPLPLLRAMAKIEVIVDNAFASFSAVSIDKVNEKGFCAPEKAFLHSDYDHSYKWDDDFVRGTHLVGGKNAPAAAPVNFVKVSERDEAKGIKEVWRAYVPEFDNTGNGDNDCKITVTLANPENLEDWKNPTQTISFKRYSEEGKPTDEVLDIERNNIYRFIVDRFNATKLNFVLELVPYIGIELKPDFGFDDLRPGKKDKEENSDNTEQK